MTRHGDEDSQNDEQVKVLSNLLNKIFRQQIIRPPPTFEEGDKDIKAHICQVEEYLILANIFSEREKVSILLNSLNEDTRSEILMQHNYEHNKNSFDWIKDKLIDLYQPKTSEASLLLKLFSIQQGNDSTIEFARRIRIKAYKLIGHLDTDEREKYMLEAFCAGLTNKKLAITVKALNPNTLNEAVEAIKAERKNSETMSEDIFEVKKTNDTYSLIAELIRRIEFLERKVARLENNSNIVPSKAKLQQQQRRMPYQQQRFQPSYSREKSSQCFSCGKFGHFARNCKSRRLEKVHYIDPNFESENRFRNLDDEVSSYYPEECDTNSQKEEYRQRSKIANYSKKEKSEPNDVNKYLNYINGKGPFPEEIHSCMLTNSNKPIVFARFNERKGKTLLDTGASCNLIGKKFLSSIRDKWFSGQVDSTKKPIIKCANNSKMDCEGEVTLPFSIGSVRTEIKCYVVNDLSVDAIIGLRTMKRLGLRLALDQDCVFCNNIAIPFESIINQSTTVINEEN